ncbi:gluconate 5-dehydrogenase [Apiospora marii]|uniref:Gluconate 5-dehydrogenase n=1 Tax=Apiospora marii TaxID=335849 RepID=A0ABR1RZB0_9PEZI
MISPASQRSAAAALRSSNTLKSGRVLASFCRTYSQATSNPTRQHTSPLITQNHRIQPTYTKSIAQIVRMASNSANANFSRDSLFDLTGHVALITGGGTGIGLMATQALVANGAKVYITGRTREKLDREDISNLAKEIEKRESGGLCILINNAGISTPTVSPESNSAEEMKRNLFDTENATFEDWRESYNTNVASLYFTTAAFLPLLQKSSEKHPGWSGTVINISSISGLIKTAQHHFAYNASKGAAVHLNRMLAAEVAGQGLKIRINSIAPGVFPSEMTAGESGEDQKSHIPKERVRRQGPRRPPGQGRGHGAGGAVLRRQPVPERADGGRGRYIARVPRHAVENCSPFFKHLRAVPRGQGKATRQADDRISEESPRRAHAGAGAVSQNSIGLSLMEALVAFIQQSSPK